MPRKKRARVGRQPLMSHEEIHELIRQNPDATTISELFRRQSRYKSYKALYDRLRASGVLEEFPAPPPRKKTFGVRVDPDTFERLQALPAETVRAALEALVR